jgi:hypothetical protein
LFTGKPEAVETAKVNEDKFMGGGGGGGGSVGAISGIVSGLGQGSLGLAANAGAFDRPVPPNPGPRKLADEYAVIAGAVGKAAPLVLAMQRQYGPEYQAEEQRLLRETDAFYRAQQPAMAMAQDEALLGNQLSPSQRRLIQQSVREGQSARGMVRGPSAVYEEAIGTSEYGDKIQQQRFDRALAAMNSNPYYQYTGKMQPNYNQLVYDNSMGKDVASTNWNYAADQYLAGEAYNRAMRMAGYQAVAQSFNTSGGSGGSFQMPQQQQQQGFTPNSSDGSYYYGGSPENRDFDMRTGGGNAWEY